MTRKDIAVASAEYVKEKNYWLKKMSGELAKSTFPYDYRENVTPPAKGSLDFKLPADIFTKLMKLSHRFDYTLHVILAAGMVVLLDKYTYDGNGDIVVGAPIYRQKTEAEFINTVLPLRTRLKGNMTFKELLLQVKQTIIEADENQNFPIETLVYLLGMEPSKNDFPLFDAAILLENIHKKDYLQHIPLNIVFSFRRTDTAIEAEVEYNMSLYKKTTIERIIGHLISLARGILANVDTPLSGIDLLSVEEKKQLLEDFNDTTLDYCREKTVDEGFDQVAARAPHHIAAADEEKQLTYRKLNQRAHQLAANLADRGIGPGDIVALTIGRTVEMVIGIVGIIKTGAAYLPIAPDYPAERIDFILKDSKAKVLLAAPDLSKEIAKEVKIMNFSDAINRVPASVCYVLYTSGSTGRPRGVMVTHRNVRNLVYGLEQRIYKQYQVSGSLKVCLVAPYIFDASVQQVFAALLLGHCLHIVPEDTRVDGAGLMEFFQKYGINIADGTPIHIGLMLAGSETAEFAMDVKHFLIGGEALPLHTVHRFFQRFGANGPRITNVYGPTECCVDSTSFLLDKENIHQLDTIPIGKPMPNQQVYIADKANQPQPVGIPGELCIGGDGVGRGYLNNPELTSRKFQIHNNPRIYRSHRSHRSYKSYRSYIYRTGDLARWLPDGNIEFSGRMDDQVKIRGFRIEPGEIENQLLFHDEVRDAVVMVRTDKDDEKYLCAYVVAEDRRALPRLKTYLLTQLPDYMVPSAWVKLDRIPITPNGKVDRKALPAPRVSIGDQYAAPENELQKQLVGIWGEVLGIDPGPIGIDANFFEMGGHSLKATTLVSRIHQCLHVKVPLVEVFKTPDIRELSLYIAREKKTVYSTIEPAPEKEYYDLSYAQERLWIICQFEEDSIAYNLPGACTFDETFDGGALKRALQGLVDRHEIFRTVFIKINEKPRQKILQRLEVELEEVDLRDLEEKEKIAAAREIYVKNARKSFHLERGPLFIFKLLLLEDKKFLLIYNIHHLVTDGWSEGILVNDVTLLYNAFLQGKENPLPQLKLQYRDYSRWHNARVQEGAFSAAGKYWLEKFKDKPNGVDFPLDYSRKALQTFAGGTSRFIINREKTLKIKQLGQEENTTLYMMLLAFVDVFLYRYTGQEDIIVGSPIANRERNELKDIVGFLVNTLVYRIQLDPAETFRDLLEKVKQETLACYRNQDYPFNLLIDQLELDRDLSQSPLFNVMLAHDNTGTLDDRLQIESLTQNDYNYQEDYSPGVFDVIFIINENDDLLSGSIMCNVDLFEPGTIERMAINFASLVDSIIDRPDIPLCETDYMDAREYSKVTKIFNETDYPFPPRTLHELFEEQVEKIPDSTAVVSTKGESITYKHLNKRANQLAHYLREECSIGTGDIVGISLDRSIEMIIVIWAVIKAGAGYVSIDPNYPEDRILHMLNDSQAEVSVIHRMPPGLFDNYRGRIVNIHGKKQDISGKPGTNPGVTGTGADIVYVIYTSGSTGTPNGAMLSQDILVNLLQWQREKTGIHRFRRCLQFTSINFCVSFQEIVGTLTTGGELHLIGDIERQDIDYLMDFLSWRRIEILYLPFSYLNFLFNESSRWGESFKPSLKHIITAGEQLKITHGLEGFLERNPGIKLHNHYGSSEMHVVTSYTLDAATAAQMPIPPAGKPIANTRIYILDETHRPVPIGVWGELCVEGCSEIAGYINNEALTEKKLLKAPFLPETGIHLYCSGDIGRWLPDGNIELRGRKDTQIKIRGFRVELSEIESKILGVDGVKDCVVVAKERSAASGHSAAASEQKYLAAYVVLDNTDIKTIKQVIASYLPLYMIPQFMVLEALPLMPNGKVDRENLPEPVPDIGVTHHIDAGKITALLKKGIYRDAHLGGISLQSAGSDELEKVLTRMTFHLADLLGIEKPVVSRVHTGMLSEEEQKELLSQLNRNTRFPLDKTLHRLFEDQVETTPDSTAIEGTGGLAPLPEPEPVSVTYNQLNRKSNQLAHLLRSKGVKANRVVGLLLEPSIDMVIGILGILKAGGAWFYIEPGNSTNNVTDMLEQNNVSIIVTRVGTLNSNHHVFVKLQALESHRVELFRTSPRPQVLDFDRLPIPDRSYIKHERYGKHIGLAMVKHTLTLQGTRGCPYNCAFCHKIWPKRHVIRTAENIYKEVEIYYKMGFGRFVFVDDIFNLNVPNSRRFFELIIENNLDIQLMFPAGLRGDTLTKDYIDLMVKAGTTNIALALETASPRLQELIRKNLNLERFREIVKYLCETYPQVVLELFTMHGFPTETEEEALMTLNFVMDMKWIHFPYINILRIYANTDMEELALRNGISREAIDRSAALAYHELPETLPFDKAFTFQYQTRFLNEYFLDKKRLLHVLPFQMKIFTEDEIVQKYNSFLPAEITGFNGLLEFAGIKREELTGDTYLEESPMAPVQIDKKIRDRFPGREPDKDALRVLLLDLSQRFAREKSMLYDGVETPLGLMYVLTYLKQQLGPKVIGAAAKSRTDFAGYYQLKKLLDDFKPDLIGIRTLTYFADFFHEAVSMMRQWGVDVPIIAGGPYATSDYSTILKDPNVDLVVMSEGEITFCQLVEEIIRNNGKLPGEETLKEIPGLVFRRKNEEFITKGIRDILLLDAPVNPLSDYPGENPDHTNQPADLANVCRGAISPGRPERETVTVTHLNANLFLSNLEDRFPMPPGSGNPGTGTMVSYGFDASLQQAVAPLLQGGTLCIVPPEMRVSDIALLEFYYGGEPGPGQEGLEESFQVRLLKWSSPGTTGIGLKKPRDQYEEKLVEIWSGVLEIEKHFISREDNFFDLGGHSLRATTMVSKIHRAFDVKVPLVEVFKFPTISELAPYIKNKRKDSFAGIEPVEKREYYPLSSAQKRLYVLQHMKLDGKVYNMPFVMLLEGNLTYRQMESTFRQLLVRHDSLRTSVGLVNGEPVQHIHDDVDFQIEYYDMKEVKVKEEEVPFGQISAYGEDTKGHHSSFIIHHSFVRPFDLSRAPLLRVGLIKLAENQHVFMVDMHHIVTDGTSMGILVREFMAIYSGETLPEPRTRYNDFSRWQNRLFLSEEFKPQQAYWRKQFEDGVPVLDMPTDHPKPGTRDFAGAGLTFEIDPGLTAQLKQVVSDTGTTLFMVLLAVHTLLLSKYTRREDIVVGTGIAGRQHADLRHVVGLFINMLAIRNRPQKHKSFLEFLSEVKDNTLNAFANQDYQYEELVDDLDLHGNSLENPLFDTVFQVQNIELPELKIPGLTLKPYNYNNPAARHDLIIYSTESEDGIHMRMIYSTQLFLPDTAQKLADRFIEILEQVLDNREIKLKDINLSQELIRVKDDILQEQTGDFEF